MGSPPAILTLPASAARMQVGQPAAVMVAPDTEARLLCDDQLAETFTTPTLTSWTCVAEDLGPDWIHVHFSAVTAGTACRVKFKLSLTGHPDMRSGYSSPEQLTPHACMIGLLTPIPGSFISDSDRGITYDLYWAWTSGMSDGAWELVAANAVYVPLTGEGDFPQSG